jgi:CsoR family transcriptional regulator, copper-sensing transcriptional repressor
MDKKHEHIMPDGTVISHMHEEKSAHVHTHTHTQTKAVLNRMSRLIGHLESIRKMVESGRDCSEVLIQLSAVNSALRGVGKIILKDHIEHCIVDAIREDDREAIEKLDKAIDQFMR